MKTTGSDAVIKVLVATAIVGPGSGADMTSTSTSDFDASAEDSDVSNLLRVINGSGANRVPSCFAGSCV